MFNIGNIISYHIPGPYNRPWAKRPGRTSIICIMRNENGLLIVYDLDTKSTRSISVQNLRSRGFKKLMPDELNVNQRNVYNSLKLDTTPSTNEEQDMINTVKIKEVDIELSTIEDLLPGECLQTKSGCYVGVTAENMILDLNGFMLLPKMTVEHKIGFKRKLSIHVT